MSTIALKSYHEEINKLYKREVFDEVVGHCHHILKHFPKELDTYRLLGSALLQLNRHTEAAEVFRRILSAVPRDYTAHQGLSQVAEIEADMDGAIWHAERIFEAFPGNTATVNELRRLYRERDGHDIERIQLTRAALAQQYLNGQHYEQAIAELRQALAVHAERPDMQLMLMHALYDNQQTAEAGETALALLEKLPDCLEANQVMADLWLANKRPENAQPFLKRVSDLAPYTGAEMIAQQDVVDPDTFRLPRLDWQAEALSRTTTVAPDWLNDFSGTLSGDASKVFTNDQESATAPEDAPDWFVPGGELSAQAGAATNVPETDLDDWFSDLQAEADRTPPSTPKAEQDLPDLFDDMGFEADDYTEPKPADNLPAPVEDARYTPEGFTGFLDGLSSPDESFMPSMPDEFDDAELGEQPEWLSGLADMPSDEDENFDLPAMDDLFGTELADDAPASTAQPESEMSGMTDWLSGLGDEDDSVPPSTDDALQRTIAEDDLPEPLHEEHRLTGLFASSDFDDAQPSEQSETIADDANTIEAVSLTSLFQTSDFEAWDEAEDEDLQETFEEEVFASMQSTAADDSPSLTDFLEGEVAQTSDDFDDLFGDADAPPTGDTMPELDFTNENDDDSFPDFDDLFGDSTPEDAAEPERTSTGLTGFLDQDDVDDFQLDLGTTTDEDLDDILAATRPPSEDEVAALIAAARGEDASQEDDFDWMSDIDAAEPGGDIPDWMGGLDEGEPAAESAISSGQAEDILTNTLNEADIPDWLGGLAEDMPATDAAFDFGEETEAAQPTSQQQQDESLPDWLQAASAASSGALLPPDLPEMDAASFAENAAEAQPIADVPPEEPDENVPGWLAAFTGDELPEPPMPEPSGEDETMLAQASDMPDNNLVSPAGEIETSTTGDFSFNYDFLDVRPAWLRDSDDAGNAEPSFTPPWLRDS